MPERRKGNNRIWRKITEFASRKEAEENVTQRQIWKKCDRKETAEGYKIVYRCTAERYKKNECSAGLYILYHCDSTAVSLFKTECDHTNHVSNPTRGLSADVKNLKVSGSRMRYSI